MVRRTSPPHRRRRALLLGAALVAAVVAVALVALQRGDDPAPRTGGAAPEPKVPAPRERPGVVLWGSDFEDGDLSVYRDEEREGAGREARVEVTTEVARSGRRSVKLTMPPSTAAATIARLQLVAGLPDDEPGAERWYGISVFLGPGFSLEQLDENRALFVSTLGFRYTETDENGPGNNLGAVRDDGGPPLFKTDVNFTGDPDGGGAQRTFGPVVLRRWVDFVVHVRWSSGADGLREVWRNGVRVDRYEGPTITRPSAFEHRMGLYQGVAVDQERTLYWDDHRVGDSYAAVDPAR